MAKISKTLEEIQERELRRLIMSYQDFQHASWIASYILDKKLQDIVDQGGTQGYDARRHWQALNCAMVVTYCRPFSGNDKRTPQPIPDLHKRFLKKLTLKGRKWHDVAMQDRDKVLAHSDSDAWNLRLGFLETGRKNKMLILQHHDTKAPLIREVVKQLIKNCEIFMEAIMVERRRLEKELAHVLPTVKVPSK